MRLGGFEVAALSRGFLIRLIRSDPCRSVLPPLADELLSC